jgi:hypothetical protein
MYRRVAVVLAATLALLVTTPVDPVAGEERHRESDYQLVRVEWGRSELHRLVLMFRYRHPEVTADRNVAAFVYEDGAGIEWAVVVASVSGFSNSPRSTPIDIFRRAPGSREWVLTRGGRPVDRWRSDRRPSDLWTTESRPEILGSHAEKIAWMFLADRGVAALVDRGITERGPCDSPGNNCRVNLKPRWFERLVVVEHVVELGDAGDAQLAQHLGDWRMSGAPIGPYPAQMLSFPGDPPAQGAAVRALSAGSNPGGIDFSTLELRYLAEPRAGQGIHFAFTANQVTAVNADVDAGRTGAIQASDAFFVWLSLPPSTFWVNLHPYEPDRIVDPKLGSTDVGRILLEADLQMKRTVGKLIHPDTPLGRAYWTLFDGSGSHNCASLRQWIVPAPATIREEDGALYILDAPLSVRMESEHVPQPAQGTVTSSACARPDRATVRRVEGVFRRLVLPRVEQAVNHAPEYAELRRVYLSRVAAEWYRQRSHQTKTTLAALIDSGNVSPWPAQTQWSPRKVFDQYVESFTKGEFNLRRRTTRGNLAYTYLYVYGGVDLGTVPFRNVDEARFRRQWPSVPETVRRSIQEVAPASDGRIWLGATAQPTVPDDWGGSGNDGDLARHLAMIIVSAAGLIVISVVVALPIIARTRRPRSTLDKN